MTQSNPSSSSSTRQNERNASRTRSPRGKSPSGRMSRWPCKDYLKGSCNNSFCERWHPPECLFYKTKSGCRFGEKCSYAHRQVDEQPTKGSKKNDDKSAVAMLEKGDWHESLVINQGHDRPGQPGKKRVNEMERGPSKHQSSNARLLGCVFQDMKPPKSVLRKSTNMQRPIQRVIFTKAIARHTKIRDQNPSLETGQRFFKKEPMDAPDYSDLAAKRRELLAQRLEARKSIGEDRLLGQEGVESAEELQQRVRTAKEQLASTSAILKTIRLRLRRRRQSFYEEELRLAWKRRDFSGHFSMESLARRETLGSQEERLQGDVGCTSVKEGLER